ncbi:hypothetical protein JMA18_17735 [Acinetobacter baumannii]|jgi:hypothetical protein|uniref:SMODS and SLOG-associating 2TM effector domain-containing protein n=10 Tax=Moraxellaceae TaxID=468 RepID=A0A7G6AF31_ACIBA|nr:MULTISPECIES: hypothetical protein [Acinetobacter]MDR0069580.1 hypothetical protein [Acinetobacter sp. 11520]AVN20374.1 hypothetical protein C6N17_00410 [Acinetobacter pittii]EFF84555.1 hypothetical protein HMPREF0013_03667 [Acinetobacter sp. SH024]EHU1847397.1 hypothetical protein [Acinetobacter baumannii]EHU3108087.1 hypothetical protein [Acinetobacter baumannii]
MNDSDDRNHKVILEYLQKVLERERDRFYKLDDKVSKLFTTVSTVITGFLIIVNILLDHNKISIFCSSEITILSLLSLTTFCFLCMSWNFLFKVFNLKKTAHLQHQGFWKYYKNREEIDFYERIIKDHETVIDTYIESNDQKVLLLKKSLSNIYLSAIMFVILVIIYLIFKYLK